MYAVILSGGKQYRIREGETLKVESLPFAVGENVTFDKILAAGEGSDVKIGRPFLENTTVTADVIAHGRHKKIRIVKFKRRKHHEKWQGHRQNYTELKITKIIL